MKPRLMLILAGAVGVAALAVYAGGPRLRKSLSAVATPLPPSSKLPTTRVKRGDVVFTVASKGDLQGGNSETISAPMTGGRAVAITFLRDSGELVKQGDIVVQFDTTEQEFALREAEADLAEAEQQLIQANAESKAKEEEARYALLQAKSDLAIAKLEMQRNELLPAMVARQNELAVASTQGKVTQLEKDLDDRIATAKAGIAIQQAAQSKAKVAAETARRNIEAMTIKAKSSGYVARMSNMEGNWVWGAYQPALQVGDTIEAGVAVAQIPDMHNWEATANIAELDRGYLSVGQKAEISVVALPGQKFRASVKNIGGTTGPPWNRRFECKLGVENPVPGLRPGMSVEILITTETLRQALWIPSQALFESDGRKFVYAEAGNSFTPRDVKLVRRSESQVVIDGLQEGQLVSLASPEQMRGAPNASKGGSALKAISQ